MSDKVLYVSSSDIYFWQIERGDGAAAVLKVTEPGTG